MPIKIFVGVDPGAKGAICILSPETNEVHFLDTTEKPYIILEFFKKLLKTPGVHVCKIMIEDVHSIFGVSAKANFTFGRNLGLLHGLLGSTGIGIDVVAPKKWQKHVGVKKKGKEIKKEVAEICGRLYPKAVIHGPKGRLHDGKSDSLMIAHYCMFMYK